MNKITRLEVAFALLIISAALNECRRSPGFEDILRLLPTNTELSGWTSQGDPQIAVGDDLYLLINGGAETYLRYGFSRAVIHSYEHTQGGMFNLEIYEMTDTAAADSIFKFKVGTGGDFLEIGDIAILESYYLNCMKGRYVVTIIGLDTSDLTRQALIQAARIVESRIQNQPDTAGENP